ncbi:MAG: hypothetical protein ABJD11_04010 [Gemmatimonadota bacterium]
MPQLPENRVLAHWGGTDVLLVTNESSVMQRELAARVAERARLDTPFSTPAYTVGDTDENVRIFLARAADRAVGLAVLRPRVRWGWWSWDDFDAEQRPSTPVAPLPSWTVELIWALPRAQQQGLARRLLDVAAQTVDQPISSFGWRRPFTPSGEAFVRRACPVGFWVPD